MMAIKPVKILAVCPSPSRDIIAPNRFAYTGGGLPVLMAGDPNVNNSEWNSMLISSV
jgi:hypothetical protein